MQSSTVPQERITVSQAINELADRLNALRRRTEAVRYDITGDIEEGETPAPQPLALDHRVFELFTTLAEIEKNFERVVYRLGVGEDKKLVPATKSTSR